MVLDHPGLLVGMELPTVVEVEVEVLIFRLLLPEDLAALE